LRLALGFFCAYHGYIKIMANGGTNWYPSWPVGLQLLVAWGEFVAGLGVLAGFKCRFFAAVLLALNLGTLVYWQGWRVLRLPVQTLELSFLLSLMSLALVFIGAGDFSMDGKFAGALGMGKGVKRK
jgi:uncharacterized membrane protein YphA (DoxX/SURF4 family)